MRSPKSLSNNVSNIPGRFSEFLNFHANQSVIVCGCGSSLKELTNPEEFITIGVNDIGRLFDPDYLVVLNSKNQFKGDRYRYIENSQASAIFTHLTLGIKHHNIIRFKLGKRGGTDISDLCTLPYTRNSPYVAVCLAAYMGAKRIGLIGVDFTEDHFFAKTGKHGLSSQTDKINQEYKKLAHSLSLQGIELINLSSISKISSLNKLSLLEFKKNSKPGSFVQHEKDFLVETHKNTENTINVVHIAKTNCAGAIWNLHSVLNKYSKIKSRVITVSTSTNGMSYPKDLLLSDIKNVESVLRKADLIHFHNNLDKDSPELIKYKKIIINKPALLQFHSEPGVLKESFPGRNPVERKDIVTLAIAQKHTRFYPNAIPVPNIIDINHPLLVPSNHQKNRKPVVIYNPTDRSDYRNKTNTCRGKGYRKTLAILKKLEKKQIIKLVLGYRVPWNELMKKRATADILIDECITGGYHMTSLEGLSQGLATFAFLDKITIEQICNITGSAKEELPWVNINITNLNEKLIELANDSSLLNTLKKNSREWIEKYWSPQSMLQHYNNVYDDIIYNCKVFDFSEKQSNIKNNNRRHYKVDGVRTGRSENYPQAIHLNDALLSRTSDAGEKSCHILGNGPSLNNMDLSCLFNQTVIGVNATPLLHEKLGRASDFYCVSDRRFFARENASEIFEQSKESTRVFAGYCHGFLKDEDINYIKICGGDGISSDIYKGFYHGCSVVVFASQLALWLGYKHIYLYGCEFNYDQGRFYNEDKVVPADTQMYPRVIKNFKLISEYLAAKGGTLNMVGPSRLVGDFGDQAVHGIRKLPVNSVEKNHHCCY